MSFRRIINFYKVLFYLTARTVAFRRLVKQYSIFFLFILLLVFFNFWHYNFSCMHILFDFITQFLPHSFCSGSTNISTTAFCHTCPSGHPKFGAREWQYGAEKWIEFHSKALECYDFHILEKPVRKQSFWNLWIPDYESISFNEGRTRDIQYHKNALELWKKDLVYLKRGEELSELISYHTWRATWNVRLAFIVYPALLASVWLWVLAIAAK